MGFANDGIFGNIEPPPNLGRGNSFSPKCVQFRNNVF
jgi:hypothetical protein